MYKMKKKRPRILYFSFITPTERFGGGIGALQSLHSLSSFADVTYVGPEFNQCEFDEYNIKLERVCIIKQNNDILKRVARLVFRGITTSFFESWFKIVTTIDAKEFDCCYLDYARQDFVVCWAKEKGLPVIVRAHNVESDYFDALYKKRKNLTNFIHKKLGKRAEKKCIQYSNVILALTPQDQRRLAELYGRDNNIKLMPVCVKQFNTSMKERLPEPFVAITGSLWFGPNAEGTIWFLENVWSKLDEDLRDKYALVIAGSNPNDKIRHLADKIPNVFLYSNPNDIDPYYLQAYAYVAPIFYGAGMKVKIAEALSCGLPVITTNHSSAGYESVQDLITVCETSDDFIQEIRGLLKTEESAYEQLRKRISEGFKSHYSLLQSCKIVKETFEGIIEG